MDQLADHVKHGDHLCVVCDSPEEKLDAAAQYIADGLRANELVMYAADAHTTGMLKARLAREGLDVEGAIARGALNLPTAYDAYLRNGEFNPDLMYATFEKAISDALAAGYTGCRFAGEPIWAIEKASLRPGLIDFELRLNGLFRARKAAGLCVYDRQSWPATVVRDVLRTHPVAVVGDVVCKRNLYFERPDLIDRDSAADSQVRWMLSQLRELSAQEDRLQIALEAGRLGSWELNVQNDTSIRSLRHDQIFGYDRPLARWGYEIFMEHVVPEDRAHVDAAFKQALDTRSTWHFECRIRRASDGAVRWIEAHGRPDCTGPGGQIERLLGIVSDITERKELEQALREADRRKDEFLATLAHELRNPLAPILNSLELIRLKSAADPQLMRARDVIERQTKHLVRLVDDLLEVSRITTGRIDLQRQRIDLGTVLASALESSQPLIDAGRHSLSLEVPQKPIFVRGDPTRLSQIFLNLLNNAAKYTPPQGRIVLSVTVSDEQVEIRIADNGIGFQQAQVSEFFKMFVQGQRSGERGQTGLGVGLPLAKRLVELHGGTIDARSEGAGRGSEFIVRLPTLRQEEPTEAASPAATQRPSSSRRILLVDDNVDAAESLAMNLEISGHEVHVRFDGRTAVEAARSVDPQVVVLDIGLPDLDGYAVARAIRELKPDVTLIALTGWGQERDRQRAREAGFNHHRTKPVNPSELLSVIASEADAQKRMRN